MPLAFKSMNHGMVAFGFFNIDTDMLLLDRYFFFADSFCELVTRLTQKKTDSPLDLSIQAYCMENREDIGDLMGAIHGIRYTGFIGEVYSIFPFPKKSKDFKQKPDGFKNRDRVEKIISNYTTGTEPVKISFPVNNGKQEIAIGSYRFLVSTFIELVRYVIRGGYPQWKDGIKPDYVFSMEKNACFFLEEPGKMKKLIQKVSAGK